METQNNACEVCGYKQDATTMCADCKLELCGDCHNAHADDIQFNGNCNPELN
jgi:hypothetical protein